MADSNKNFDANTRTANGNVENASVGSGTMDINDRQGGIGGKQALDIGSDVNNVIRDSNVGGRSAGGEAGTGGVSTNDVGSSGSKRSDR